MVSVDGDLPRDCASKIQKTAYVSETSTHLRILLIFRLFIKWEDLLLENSYRRSLFFYVSGERCSRDFMKVYPLLSMRRTVDSPSSSSGPQESHP